MLKIIAIINKFEHIRFPKKSEQLFDKQFLNNRLTAFIENLHDTKSFLTLGYYYQQVCKYHRDQ